MENIIDMIAMDSEAAKISDGNSMFDETDDETEVDTEPQEEE